MRLVVRKEKIKTKTIYPYGINMPWQAKEGIRAGYPSSKERNNGNIFENSLACAQCNSLHSRRKNYKRLDAKCQ